MGLTPQARALLDTFPARPPRAAMSVAENRASVHRMVNHFAHVEARPVRKVEDLTIPVDGGQIAARRYVPNATEPLPVLVYAHGGGWALGDLDTHDRLCRNLAALAESAVVAVDYRRPPEHRFPTALEDVCAAVEWVREQASTLGVDATRLAVGGDSAGGNLAAASCLRLRDTSTPPVHQLLIVPVLDTRPDAWESYQRFADDYGLTADDMTWYFDQYFGPDRREQDDRLAAPYRAQSLAGLPSATVITAECDVLRDEAEAYAHRLADARVPLNLRRYDGMFHQFCWLTPLEEALAAQAYAARHLRQAFT